MFIFGLKAVYFSKEEMFIVITYCFLVLQGKEKEKNTKL